MEFISAKCQICGEAPSKKAGRNAFEILVSVGLTNNGICTQSAGRRACSDVL